MGIITELNITFADVILRYIFKQLLFINICDLLGVGCKRD